MDIEKGILILELNELFRVINIVKRVSYPP